MDAISNITPENDKPVSDETTLKGGGEQKSIDSIGLDAKEFGGDKLAQVDYMKLYEERTNGVIAQLKGLSQQDVKNVLNWVNARLPDLYRLDASL